MSAGTRVSDDTFAQIVCLHTSGVISTTVAEGTAL